MHGRELATFFEFVGLLSCADDVNFGGDGGDVFVEGGTEGREGGVVVCEVGRWRGRLRQEDVSGDFAIIGGAGECGCEVCGRLDGLVAFRTGSDGNKALLVGHFQG